MSTLGTSSDTTQNSKDSLTSPLLDFNFFKTTLPEMNKRREKLETEIETLRSQVDRNVTTLFETIQTLLATYSAKYDVNGKLANHWFSSSRISDWNNIGGLKIDHVKRTVSFDTPMPYVSNFTFDELTNVQTTLKAIEAGKDRYAKLFMDQKNTAALKRFMKYKELEKEFGRNRNTDTCCGPNGCSAS